MIEEAPDAAAQTLARFDEVIDVRAPAEFAEDHIPGAISLPVLSNDERAAVGAIYKQVSKFEARRRGAAIIARNVAHHLETALADKPANYRPLVYCWRGGMRSGAMATILSRVGWRTGVLNGGYKAWRREVTAGLRDSEAPINVILLDGQTGTAKSEILRRLAGRGAQTVDLEDLANHRGSVFGGRSDFPQPSQKMFESALWAKLRTLDASRPVFVEAESNRIGRCEVPMRLWRAMLAAPRVEIQAGAAARTDFLLSAYADITADRETLMKAIDRLAPYHPKTRIEAWRVLVENGDLAALAEELMRDHYDPLYSRTRKRRKDRPLATLYLQNLGDSAIAAAAEEIEAHESGVRLRAADAPPSAQYRCEAASVGSLSSPKEENANV